MTSAPPARRWLRRLGLVAGCAVGIAVIVFLVWGLVLVRAIREYPTADGPASADAIVVFAGESARFRLAEDLVDAGAAPVLVLSAARLPPVAEQWCERPPGGVEVACVRPTPLSTEGEARAFADLARERGWTRLIAVTGDYHAVRSTAWMDNCWGGSVEVAIVDWPTPSPRLVRKEWFGTVGAAVWPWNC